MPNRQIWLAVSSDDAGLKANNFLKLIKPPDGEGMTDLNIKLDWNKDTSDRWTVNDAKTSMLEAGFDWEKRDPGQPLSETNFRVVWATGGDKLVPTLIPSIETVEAGDPVTYFELLEEWMGPALGPGDAWVYRSGVDVIENPPGSLYERWPSPGDDGSFNAEPWRNVFVGPPLSDSPYWWRTTIQKTKDTALSSNKVSSNGHGDSVWLEWAQAQDPDLGPGEIIRMFEANANGDPFPLRDRLGFAV